MQDIQQTKPNEKRTEGNNLKNKTNTNGKRIIELILVDDIEYYSKQKYN